MKSQLRTQFIKVTRHSSEFFALNQSLPKGVRRLFGELYGSLSYWLWKSGRASTQWAKSPNYYIATLLRPDDVYIDIGASFGGTITIAQKAVGSDGHVYAFEPQSSVYQLLTHKKNSFGWENVTLTQSVVGDQDGECTFFEDQTSRMSSISSEWAKGTPVTYPMTKLDTWTSANNIKKTDLLKIDVEGAELMVIRGGLTFLQHMKPSILLEINNRTGRLLQYGYTIDDLLSELRSVGYDRFYVLRNQRLEPFSSESELLDGDRDMLAKSPIQP